MNRILIKITAGLLFATIVIILIAIFLGIQTTVAILVKKLFFSISMLIFGVIMFVFSFESKRFKSQKTQFRIRYGGFFLIALSAIQFFLVLYNRLIV